MALRIGIRREDKNKWERRVPLTPQHVRQLKARMPIDVTIQPSPIRAFSDQEYEQAGAVVSQDLSSCPVIFGVKEIPEDLLETGKTYVFFSHVIKGQPYNMPRLKKMMDLGCQLIDYECITDARGFRTVAFGRFAGLAGIIQSLWVLGQKWQLAGYNTPLSQLKHAYEYSDLDEAGAEMERIGALIRTHGLPDELPPFICGFAGYGKVSMGAQEMFDLLGVTEIEPPDIASVFTRGRGGRSTIFKSVFKEEHLVRPKRAGHAFDLQQYYDAPDKFQPVFESYVPYLTVLVNCIYWEDRFPRLITRAYLDESVGREPFALQVIGDISCDIDGAIEITHKPTEPDRPAYTYLPKRGAFADECVADGVSVMAVDNLPCEFPKASSRSFGDALTPLVAEIAGADYGKSLSDSGLSDKLAEATILYRGELTPPFAYLSEFVASDS